MELNRVAWVITMRLIDLRRKGVLSQLFREREANQRFVILVFLSKWDPVLVHCFHGVCVGVATWFS